MPSAVRVVTIAVGALAVVDAAASASIFVFVPAQETAAAVFLGAFVHTALVMLCAVRGTEGGRTGANLLGGAGLLGSLFFSGLAVLLLLDGKAMAPVFLLWGLAASATFSAVLVVMRRPEAMRWAARIDEP